MLPILDVVYIVSSAILILVAGRHLYESWLGLIEDVTGRNGLAHALADQLVVRFYAVCGGVVLLNAAFGSQPFDFSDALRTIVGRLGVLLILISIVQIISIRSLMMYRARYILQGRLDNRPPEISAR